MFGVWCLSYGVHGVSCCMPYVVNYMRVLCDGCCVLLGVCFSWYAVRHVLRVVMYALCSVLLVECCMLCGVCCPWCVMRCVLCVVCHLVFGGCGLQRAVGWVLVVRYSVLFGVCCLYYTVCIV